ncbi:MAG TPA: hypothetical protein VE669_06305 [Actinomycetota bacterium]|jgi:hypothetical protein|nr:hypothetical protein [Actinomycetota bacterium]
MRKLLLAGGLALLMVVAVPTTGLATPPEVLFMEAHGSLDPTVTATWSSTGAIADSGIDEVDGSILTGFENPGNVTFHDFDTTRIGEHGSFSIRRQSILKDVDGPILRFEDRWVIVAGTGAYAGAHGHGTGITSVNLATGEIVGMDSGEVHFD